VRALALTYSDESQIIEEYSTTGSEKSATAFVRMYQNFVFSTAVRYIKNYDDADDISQEVFIKVLSSLPKFKGESSIKTWLYRITVNMCHNFLRRKSFISIFSKSQNDEDTYYDIPVNEPQPDKIFENKELEATFLKSLNKLPEKQRETFALRYFDELTYEEISELLGTSVGGLKANYFQAVKKLAGMLKNQV
jgi:RNA polymerase sigma-70 factor (ECF subfamily)